MKIANNIIDLRSSSDTKSIILGENKFMNIASSEYRPPYEVLSSITFNKTQMFWLPVKPAPDVKIDITFKSNNTSETQCLFGGRITASGSNRKMFAFWECVGGSSSISGYMRADYGNSSTASNDIGLSSTLTDFRNFVKDGADNYIDGVKKTSNTGTLEEDDTNTYIALGCMANGTESNYTLSNPFAGDVAQLKIWKTGLQIADYVPALDSQMQPCLYDRVSKTFLYAKKISDGTTTYNLGYTRWNKYAVSYIQNDTNSYIKTGVIDENDDLSFEADFTYFSGSGYQYVLGAYGGDSYKNTVLYINSTNSIGAWVNKGYSQTAMLPNIVETNARIKCYADTTKSIINETTSTTFVEGTARTGTEIYVFRRNGYNATPAQTTSNAIIGLHSLKINIGDVTVRDYEPSVRTNNNTTIVFLYDKVYNKAYDNAGSGSFIAGA